MQALSQGSLHRPYTHTRAAGDTLVQMKPFNEFVLRHKGLLSVGLYFSIILQLHGGVETGGGLEELRGQQHQWMAIYSGSSPEIRLFEKLFVVRASCCSWLVSNVRATTSQ